jgi:hypothetical protein
MSISDRLTQLANFYHLEARRCVRGRAYLASAIMQVSALEAALLSMCFIYPEEVKRTNVYLRKRFRKKRYRAFEFNLYELINIADGAGWFPPKKLTWAGKRAGLAGFVHEARECRNYVHPGKWARERKPLKFSKGVYGVVLEIFEVATSWLLHRIEQSLRKRMKREGLL